MHGENIGFIFYYDEDRLWIRMTGVAGWSAAAKTEPGKFRWCQTSRREEREKEGEWNENHKNNEHGINWILSAGEAETVQLVAHWHFKAISIELNIFYICEGLPAIFSITT